MEQQLTVTNILLGIMAAVSVLEGLVVISLGLAGFLIYRRIVAVFGLLHGIEQRQLEPLKVQVLEILDDVKSVTATVKEEVERVDDAIKRTVDRVDETAGRMRHTIRQRTSRLVGFVRAVRVVVERTLSSRERPTADKAGRF